ncbi:MAG: hypothetical protein HYX71_05645 [Opitutae bacterium]|nr:hypothetical protein [Opitutae bacterium]
MRAFSPAYSQEALDALVAASGSARRHARAVIAQLCRYPDRMGDAQLPQADQRDLRIRTDDHLVVSYWVDDAVREVRIVTIEWTG